jgi:hypothetical protein
VGRPGIRCDRNPEQDFSGECGRGLDCRGNGTILKTVDGGATWRSQVSGTLHEARRICPALVVLPSDYETYSLFSRRMFNILRRFTPQVEEYSIDKTFTDLTGIRRALRSSYGKEALRGQIAVPELAIR